MTYEDARNILRNVYYQEEYCLVPELAEALDTAIEALQQQEHRCANCKYGVSCEHNNLAYCYRKDVYVPKDYRCGDWSDEQ